MVDERPSKRNEVGVWWCACCAMDVQQVGEFLASVRWHHVGKHVVHIVKDDHADVVACEKGERRVWLSRG